MTLVTCPIKVVVVVVVDMGPCQSGHGSLWVVNVDVGKWPVIIKTTVSLLLSCMVYVDIAIAVAVVAVVVAVVAVVAVAVVAVAVAIAVVIVVVVVVVVVVIVDLA